MSDWFDDAATEIRKEIAEQCGITYAQANAVYGFLCEAGLIDYDVEKEVLWDRYGGGDDDD